jgi:hypothetical protein
MTPVEVSEMISKSNPGVVAAAIAELERAGQVEQTSIRGASYYQVPNQQYDWQIVLVHQYEARNYSSSYENIYSDESRLYAGKWMRERK